MSNEYFLVERVSNLSQLQLQIVEATLSQNWDEVINLIPKRKRLGCAVNGGFIFDSDIPKSRDSIKKSLSKWHIEDGKGYRLTSSYFIDVVMPRCVQGVNFEDYLEIDGLLFEKPL